MIQHFLRTDGTPAAASDTDGKKRTCRLRFVLVGGGEPNRLATTSSYYKFLAPQPHPESEWVSFSGVCQHRRNGVSRPAAEKVTVVPVGAAAG